MSPIVTTTQSNIVIKIEHQFVHVYFFVHNLFKDRKLQHTLHFPLMGILLFLQQKNCATAQRKGTVESPSNFVQEIWSSFFSMHHPDHE